MRCVATHMPNSDRVGALPAALAQTATWLPSLLLPPLENQAQILAGLRQGADLQAELEERQDAAGKVAEHLRAEAPRA